MEQRFTWASALVLVPGRPGSQRLILRRIPAQTSSSSSSSSTPASPPGWTVRSHTLFPSHTTDEASKEQHRKTLNEVVRACPPKRVPTVAPEAGPSKTPCISFKLWSQALAGFSPEDGVESRPAVKVRSPRPAVAPRAAPQRCPWRAAVAPSAAPGPGSLKAALTEKRAEKRKGQESRGEEEVKERRWEGQRFKTVTGTEREEREDLVGRKERRGKERS
ncbi:Hypothetical predicted protein [Xyrichtys novacula]|uniref:Uncharacterized protein n=1 Tax=Xyrichtys novacula TaxID=13765 RepID=A0AAV1GYD2_XYRNO|nr:Hypothetical predicted protein [Xyrichtys novacula]